VPAALTEAQAPLLGADAKARKRAAERVLAHQPADEVPAYLRNLAALEKASSCTGRRNVLEKMDASADPRVLPRCAACPPRAAAAAASSTPRTASSACASRSPA
jgi:hypothetical protein